MPTFKRPATLPAFVFVLTLLMGDLPARAELNRRLMKANFFTEKSNQAYAAKDYDEAIRYAQLVLQLQPYDAGTYYNLACSAALAGRTDEAFDALTRTIELGWDDSDWLQQDTDLKSLHDDSRWAGMLKKIQVCQDETLVLRAADSIPSTQPAPPAPLIIALHGFGGNARQFAAYWIDTMQTTGAVLAAPRGMTLAGPGQQTGYAWSAPGSPRNLDVEGAATLVEEAIEAAKKKYSIDKKKIVLAGFSQGATMALKLLAKDPDKYAGAITLAASYDTADDGSWKSDADSMPRVAIIVGELDRAHDDNESLRDALKNAGYEIQFEEIPAMGHEVPADHDKRFAEALVFLTQ